MEVVAVCPKWMLRRIDAPLGQFAAAEGGFDFVDGFTEGERQVEQEPTLADQFFSRAASSSAVAPLNARQASNTLRIASGFFA